jgi:pantetheine-phosphate adenylyltransferase
LEDYETRNTRVKNFIRLLTNNKIDARIYQLNDPCGPAGEIAEIEAVILTAETAKGGAYCNNIRVERGLPISDIVVVDMILNEKEASGEDAFSNKTSSSYIRQYLDEKTEFKAELLFKRFYDL